MLEFALKTNYFKSDSKVKRQISCAAIGIKFVPPHVWLFKNKVERELLQLEQCK